MRAHLRPALVAVLLFTILTGVVYPAVVTGVSQLFLRNRADGSLIVKEGHVVGSELIGQSFSDPGHFWGRLSATAPVPYNASASSGSNLGPSNPALIDHARRRVNALRAADPGNSAPIPVDLVTASASGLDPAISPAAASYQVARIARVRNVLPATIEALVASATDGRTFGLLGEPRVNVLRLNLALDSLTMRR